MNDRMGCQLVRVAHNGGSIPTDANGWPRKTSLVAPDSRYVSRQYFQLGFALNDVIFVLSFSPGGWLKNRRDLQGQLEARRRD